MLLSFRSFGRILFALSQHPTSQGPHPGPGLVLMVWAMVKAHLNAVGRPALRVEFKASFRLRFQLQVWPQWDAHIVDEF